MSLNKGNWLPTLVGGIIIAGTVGICAKVMLTPTVQVSAYDGKVIISPRKSFAHSITEDELRLGGLSNRTVYKSSDSEQGNVTEIFVYQHGSYVTLKRQNDYAAHVLQFEKGDYLLAKARAEYIPLINGRREEMKNK
ncbi:MAG: hypothetical protein V1725_03330 [archaeon]